MQVKISARHGTLNDATKRFIEEKAQKLLHLFNRVTMIEVTVDLKDEIHKTVEFLVSAEHKHDFVARETSADVVSAVDLVMDKLSRQLSRYKGKIQDHRRDPSASEIAGAPATAAESEE